MNNNEEIMCGRMECPNCGIERSTTTDLCICGYNPLTGKMEKPSLHKIIEGTNDEDIKQPKPIDMTIVNYLDFPENNKEIFNDMKIKFYSETNINWLQYVLIELLLNFDFSENAFNEVKKYLKIGMNNIGHIAVPRMSRDNRVIGLAASTKCKFEETFNYIKDWRYSVIEDILIGWYDIAYLVVDKL